MAFSMAGRGARGPEINVTPLIDVLLTLIIVFMVVVSMDKEQGETAQIPQPDQKHAENIAQPRTVVRGFDQRGDSPQLSFPKAGAYRRRSSLSPANSF
jgi:biopolymer transport protein TolR